MALFFSWGVKLLPVRVLHMVFIWWSGIVFKKQLKGCILWHYRMSPVVSVSALWPLNSRIQFLSDVSLKLEMFAQSLIWSIWSPLLDFREQKGIIWSSLSESFSFWYFANNLTMKKHCEHDHFCTNLGPVCVQCVGFMLKWRYACSWSKKLATDFNFSSYCAVKLLKEEIRQKGEQ